MKGQSSFEFVDTLTDARSRAAAAIFKIGVDLIMATGVNEAAARSIIGKKVKEIGKMQTLRVIAAAYFNEVSEPRTYIAAGKISAARAREAANADIPRDDDSAGIQGWMK